MPGSSTTPGRPGARTHAPVRVAFRFRNGVSTRDMNLCEAQWLAYVLPYRRFAAALTGSRARLRADVDRYSVIVSDLHRLLVAGLPAHCERFWTLPLAKQKQKLQYTITSENSTTYALLGARLRGADFGAVSLYSGLNFIRHAAPDTRMSANGSPDNLNIVMSFHNTPQTRSLKWQLSFCFGKHVDAKAISCGPLPGHPLAIVYNIEPAYRQ